MPERLKLLALLVASYADRAGNQFWPGEAELAELAACTGQCERDVSALLLVLCDEYGLLKHVAYGISVCLQLTVPSDLDTRFEFCAPLPDAVSRRAE